MRTSSSSPETSRQAEAGFTLIEMLAVLSLIALIAALALPRITGDPAASHPARIAKLEQRLTEARAEALRTGKSRQVDPALLGPNLRFESAIDDNRTIAFYPDGSSNGGAFFLGGKMVVTIDWLTGKVRRGVR